MVGVVAVSRCSNWPAWIRTRTLRIKISCATVTPRASVVVVASEAGDDSVLVRSKGRAVRGTCSAFDEARNRDHPCRGTCSRGGRTDQPRSGAPCGAVRGSGLSRGRASLRRSVTDGPMWGESRMVAKRGGFLQASTRTTVNSAPRRHGATAPQRGRNETIPPPPAPLEPPRSPPASSCRPSGSADRGASAW